MAKSYEDAVKLLTSVGKFRISLGLERISAVLKFLNNPQDGLKCIHVAGTNGKGSVCAMLSSVLTRAGKKVGLFTSPHIFKYTERIKINEIPISDEDFSKYVFEISEIAQEYDIDLTEFEILTAVMFKYFYDNKIEVVVLETGLGGRFDATNVIKKNLCSVITHVDYDHTERLGKTLGEIATEKAGIIKPNCPCVVFEGFEAYKDAADKNCAPLVMVSPFANPENLSLKGVFQQENLSLALAVLETVFPEISGAIIDEGLKHVNHLCRFQYIPEFNLIIDGAHNPNGAVMLKQSLDFYFGTEKRRFIFGCLKNKNYESMLSALLHCGDEVWFYKFDNPNACEVEELLRVSPVEGRELFNVSEIDFNDGHLNVICGSFYMIAELCEKFGIKVMRAL